MGYHPPIPKPGPTGRNPKVYNSTQEVGKVVADPNYVRGVELCKNLPLGGTLVCDPLLHPVMLVTPSKGTRRKGTRTNDQATGSPLFMTTLDT